MRSVQGVELYHVMNRGVDKRALFLNDRDRLRFICGLDAFNTTKSMEIFSPKVDWSRRFLQAQEGPKEGGASKGFRKPLSGEKQIVDVHGWCLMGNHYHLLLSEREEGGMVRFIRKINVGYANYFNAKNERKGALFGGRTKKVLVEREAHFLYLLHYIHLNPLDFCKGSESWRAGRIGSASRALNHLERYRWSSYLDYCGRKNFPSVVNTELYRAVFPDYKKEIVSYLGDIELSPIEYLIVEG